MTVTLRPETHEDARWLWRWHHEEREADWKKWDAPYPHATVRPESFESFVRGRAITNRWGAIIDVGGRPAGVVTRSEVPPAGGGWWDWGMVLYDPADRGQGVGSAAARMWIDETFGMPDVHVLTATTWSGNAAMLALGKKLGFRECSRVPEARRWRGARYDSVQMALLRADWEEHG